MCVCVIDRRSYLTVCCRRCRPLHRSMPAAYRFTSVRQSCRVIGEEQEKHDKSDTQNLKQTSTNPSPVGHRLFLIRGQARRGGLDGSPETTHTAHLCRSAKSVPASCSSPGRLLPPIRHRRISHLGYARYEFHKFTSHNPLLLHHRQ